MVNSLEKLDVIPDVLPSGTQTSAKLWLDFGGKAKVEQAGTPVDRQTTQTEPDVYSDVESDSGALYTIIMTDPDLLKKNDQMSGQVRHWLQPGLKFSGANQPAKKTTDAVSNYVGCAPAPGTGAHRYVFILARQGGSAPSRSDFPNAEPRQGDEDLKDRMGFNAYEYIQQKGLEVVGVTMMEVSANVQSAVDNVKLGAEAVAHKIQGT